MPTCAVYAILNSVTGKVYFGSSMDVAKRWSVHRRTLTKGIHHNRHLQRSWDLYGQESFIFILVRGCRPEDRFQVEDSFIRSHNSDMTYNQGDRVGGNRLGQHNTPEANAKISAANRGRTAWLKGKSHAWGPKAGATYAARNPFQVEAQHLDGRVQTFSTTREAAAMAGCVRKSVSNCLNGLAKTTKDGWSFRWIPKTPTP